jgi:hypothetical protein
VGPGTDGYSWDFVANANPWEFFGTGTGTMMWTAGKPAGTYFAGGSILCDNLNSASIFLGCYMEAGVRFPALRGSSVMMGGAQPVGLIGRLDGNSLLSRGGSYSTTGDLMPLSTFGGNTGNVLEWNHRDDSTANAWRLRRGTNLNDWVIDNGASASRQVVKFTGERTLETMGTGVGIPYQFNLQTLALGVGTGMRRVTMGASPTTGNFAVGDVIWNNAPGGTAASGWRCTTAGTVGTLNAGATTGSITSGSTTLTVNSATGLTVGNAIIITGVANTKWVTAISGTTVTIHAAANATVSGAAVAYAVPTLTPFGDTLDMLRPAAGGAVVQATSKATGVTLNTICGRVTTFNDALAAATSVSFTLTNSKIAAVDIIQTSITSGATAGAYGVIVDAVAAGSCRISIYNRTAAPLSEAIVINFVVIKGSIT